MYYPGTGSAVSVERVFVDGVQIDICEVNPSHYEFLSPIGAGKKPGGRFFMEIEGQIVGYQLAAEYCVKTGDCRWDFFCADKSYIKGRIDEIQELLSSIRSLEAKLLEKPLMGIMIAPKIADKKARLLNRYFIKI